MEIVDTDTHSILFLRSQRLKRFQGSEALYVSVVQTDVANKSSQPSVCQK